MQESGNEMRVHLKITRTHLAALRAANESTVRVGEGAAWGNGLQRKKWIWGIRTKQ